MTGQDQEDILCYIDGSTLFNGLPNAKGASAVCFPNGEIPHGAYHLPPTWVRSNNRCEYYAAIKAMELVNEYDPEKTKDLHIFTDSLLLLNTCTKWMHSWHNKNRRKSGGEIKNLDLVKILYEHCENRTVRWTHVPAHKTDDSFETTWNNKVDKLAYSIVRDDDNSQVVFPEKKPEALKISSFVRGSKAKKSNKRRKTG